MRVLAGFTVVDFSRFLSGPYCTKVLGEMGADVIKVEKPGGGDDARHIPPHVDGESYPFALANTSKRSIAVDLKTELGRDVALRLIKSADCVVENFRPGVMKRLGLGYEVAADVNPSIIYCSISGFGQTGANSERPGFDIIAQGAVGFMRMMGHKGETEPLKMGIAITDIAAGMTALSSILYAQIARQNTGAGDYLDVSLFDSALAWSVWEAGAYFASGELPEPNGSRHRLSAPYQAFRTRDGYVTVGANNEHLWQRFCEKVLEVPELMEDDRFRTAELRLEKVEQLEAEIESILSLQTTEYWTGKLDGASVPGGPVLRFDEALESRLASDRQMVEEIEHPKMGRIKVLGVPSKSLTSPMKINRPAPCLGEHTEEILAESGYSSQAIEQLIENQIVETWQGREPVPSE